MYMTGPLVTAVLPTFNRGSLLEDAVESVLGQSYENLELLIVDDASDEEQKPKLSHLEDPRVRLLERETNGGVAAAQNTGLRAARGEYVAFIHSDDTWEVNKLLNQVEALAENPSAAAIESATTRLSGSNWIQVYPRLLTADFDDLMCRRVRNLHISGFMFRTDRVKSLGGFDETLRSYEDFDLLLRLTRTGWPIFSDHVVSTIDQRGADRLGHSPWMVRARMRLLDKYERELVSTYGRLPDGWSDWAAQLAVQGLKVGDGREVRKQLARVRQARPSQTLKVLPLWFSSYGGTRVAKAAGDLAARRMTGAST